MLQKSAKRALITKKVVWMAIKLCTEVSLNLILMHRRNLKKFYQILHAGLFSLLLIISNKHEDTLAEERLLLFHLPVFLMTNLKIFSFSRTRIKEDTVTSNHSVRSGFCKLNVL